MQQSSEASDTGVTSPENRPPEYAYLPALKWRILARFYDFACALAFLGRSYKSALLDAVTLQDGQKVLDVGCGTGQFIEILKERHPSVSAYGADPDASLLGMAEGNLRRKGLSAKFVQAYAEQLPFPDDTFDMVSCILTLHHVPTGSKQQAVNELRRVLAPGGILLLSDYGKKRIPVRGPGQFIFEQKANLVDHFAGRVPQYIKESGLHLETERKYHQVFIWIARK